MFWMCSYYFWNSFSLSVWAATATLAHLTALIFDEKYETYGIIFSKKPWSGICMHTSEANENKIFEQFKIYM